MNQTNKRKSIKNRVKPKIDHFFGSLTDSVFKTMNKATQFRVQNDEKHSKQIKIKTKKKTKETHNMKEARGGRCVA